VKAVIGIVQIILTETEGKQCFNFVGTCWWFAELGHAHM